MSSQSPIIVWFRNDLRLIDNPALYKAAETGRPVIPVFIYDMWAMDRDYVAANPASKLAPKREPSGPKRLPFSQDDLLRIFEPEQYAKYPRHEADY